MTNTERLEDFRSSLNKEIMYKVENAKYTYARAEDMTLEDLQSLAEKAATRGKDSILEDAIADLNKLIL